MKTSTNTNSSIYLQDLRRKSANGADSTRPARREPRSYAQVSSSGYGYAAHSAAPSSEKTAEAEPEATPTIQLTPQAQQLQSLPAAQLQSLQTQARSVQQQKTAIMQNQPTYTEVARDSARKFFKDNYNLDLDPDTTYLNTFRPPSMDRMRTAPPEGYTHPGGDLRNSQSLTDVFLHNVDGDFTQQSQDMPETYGIYQRQDKNASYSSKDSLVPIAEFGRKFRQSDTLGDFNKRNDAFWSQNAPAMTQVSRQDAQLQVELQKKLGLGGLSDKDYEDFDIATNVDAAQTRSDIEQGEINEDKELVHRAIRRQGLAVSPLDIDGHSSHDILRVEDRKSGQNLVYIPNDEQPLRKFASRQAVGDWLHAQGRQPGWAEDFAARHFSQNDAQGREALSGDMAQRSNGLGVRKYLEQAAENDAAWEKNPELHRSELPNWKLDDRKQLADKNDIQGDAFERLTQIRREGSQADAKMDITTHADVDRGNVFKVTDWIPFVGGGLKLGLSKTREEQTEGGASLTMDTLTTALDPIFDLAPGLAAKRGAKVGAEGVEAAAKAGAKGAQAAAAEAESQSGGVRRVLGDLMRPPQKINGKWGYPLSPMDPPSGTHIGTLARPPGGKGGYTVGGLKGGGKRQPANVPTLPSASTQKPPVPPKPGKTAVPPSSQSAGGDVPTSSTGTQTLPLDLPKPGTSLTLPELSEAQKILRERGLAYVIPEVMKKEAPAALSEAQRALWTQQKELYEKTVNSHTQLLAQRFKMGDRGENLAMLEADLRARQKIQRDNFEVIRSAMTEGPLALNTEGTGYLADTSNLPVYWPVGLTRDTNGNPSLSWQGFTRQAAKDTEALRDLAKMKERGDKDLKEYLDQTPISKAGYKDLQTKLQKEIDDRTAKYIKDKRERQEATARRVRNVSIATGGGVLTFVVGSAAIYYYITRASSSERQKPPMQMASDLHSHTNLDHL